jgi:hypothetical protein
MTFSLFRWASLALLLGLLITPPSYAADGFERVRCDQPIIQALVGARSTVSEPVVRIEARRKAIRLENLGADIIEDGVNTTFWRICGRTFVLLDVRDVIRDAIELPAHSPEQPAFSASSCEVAGRKLTGDFLGVFAAAARGGAPLLPVKAAWRIDRKKFKFVPIDANATCATDGLATWDAAR